MGKVEFVEISRDVRVSQPLLLALMYRPQDFKPTTPKPSTGLDRVVESFSQDFDEAEAREEYFMELASYRLGSRLDWDSSPRERITRRSPKTEVAQRQYRIAVQLAQALSSVGPNPNPNSYGRVSRLLGALERDINAHGSHLFEDSNNTASFINTVRLARSEQNPINIELDGKSGYSTGPYQSPQYLNNSSNGAHSSNGINGDRNLKPQFVRPRTHN